MRIPIMQAVGVLGGKKQTLYQKIMALSPDLYWPLNDASGTTFAEATGKTSDTVELMTNGGFETHTGDDFGTWTETPGVGGAIQAEATVVHTVGGTACKLTQATPAVVCKLTISCTLLAHGRNYELRFWTAGDGSNQGRYALYDSTHASWIAANPTNTGVTGTDYAEVVVPFTTPAGSGAITVTLTLYAPAANGGICYYDDVSLIGKSFLFTGQLVGTGTTFESELIGGTKSILLDGNALINVFADYALPKIWDADPITIIAFAKPNFVWADAQAHNYDLWSFQGLNSSQTYVNYYASASKKMDYRHFGNGTNIDKTIDDVPTGWFSSGFVSSGNVLKPYYNGVAQATENGDAWLAGNLTVGVLSNNADAVTPFHAWIGNLAHVAIWFGEKTPEQLATLTP